MKDPNSKRLVMIGIRRKGEKRFKTRTESDATRIEAGLQKGTKTKPYPVSLLYAGESTPSRG